MSVQPRPARRPGRPPSLTRDDVARAALDEGMDSLSMTAVARRLGVVHSTLYRYVHDRDDLVLAALDLAIREYTWPEPTLAWRELLTAFSDALWSFLQGVPGVAEAIQTAPGLPPRVAELLGTYAMRLRTEGLSERDAVVALDLVADLTIATEISMRGFSRIFDTPRGQRSLREIFQASWGELDLDDPSIISEETFHGSGWLPDKLEILFDGLATRIGEASPDAKPPRRTPLSRTPIRVDGTPDRGAVVTEARALARRGGIDAVTLRTVAETLNTTAPVLFALVGDRDGLVVAILDEIAGEIDPPAPNEDPSAELTGLLHAVYTALREDAWALTALAVEGFAGPLILPVVTRIAAALTRSGVPAGDVAHVMMILWAQVFGTVLTTVELRSDSFSARVVNDVVPACGRPDVPGDRARVGISIVVDGVIAQFAEPA